jgi:hypothetical protein
MKSSKKGEIKIQWEYFVKKFSPFEFFAVFVDNAFVLIVSSPFPLFL